jgi:protein-tyrosine phosphatase
MRVLMVCLGNICRSPLAEGILKSKVESLGLDWHVDSAGTGSWHIGELPDKRSVQIAREKGIDITDQRARQFSARDFDLFDMILVMDSSNYNNIVRLARHDGDKEKIDLLLNYAYPNQNRAVPDPYYDGGFEKVFEMIDLACDKLIESRSKK